MAVALLFGGSVIKISVAWAQAPATILPVQCGEYSRPTRVRLTRAVPASMLLASAWEGLSDAEASAYLNNGEIPQRFVLLRGFPTTIQPRGLGPVNWLNPGADGVLSDEVRANGEFLRLGELVCANPANAWDAHADLVERFTRDPVTEARLRAGAAGKPWIRVLAAVDLARGPVLIRSTQYNVRINCAAQARLESLFAGYRATSADGSALDSTWALTVRARANATISIPRKGNPRLLQRACAALPRVASAVTSENRDDATDVLSDLDGVDTNMDADAELRTAVRTAKDQIKALLRRALRPELRQIAGLTAQSRFYMKLFNRRVDDDIHRQAEHSLNIAWCILGSTVFAAILFLVGFALYRRRRNRGPAPIPAEIARKAREGLMGALEEQLYQAVFFLQQNVAVLGDSEQNAERRTFIQRLDLGQPIAPQVHDLSAFLLLFRLVAEAVIAAKPKTTPPTNTTPPTDTTPGGGKAPTFTDHTGRERPLTPGSFADALKDAIASTEWQTRVAVMALALGNTAIANSLRATYDRGVAEGAANKDVEIAALTAQVQSLEERVEQLIDAQAEANTTHAAERAQHKEKMRAEARRTGILAGYLQAIIQPGAARANPIEIGAILNHLSKSGPSESRREIKKATGAFKRARCSVSSAAQPAAQTTDDEAPTLQGKAASPEELQKVLATPAQGGEPASPASAQPGAEPEPLTSSDQEPGGDLDEALAKSHRLTDASTATLAPLPEIKTGPWKTVLARLKVDQGSLVTNYTLNPTREYGIAVGAPPEQEVALTASYPVTFKPKMEDWKNSHRTGKQPTEPVSVPPPPATPAEPLPLTRTEEPSGPRQAARSAAGGSYLTMPGNPPPPPDASTHPASTPTPNPDEKSGPISIPPPAAEGAAPNSSPNPNSTAAEEVA